MRNALAIGILAAGIYLMLAVQCAVAPCALMYDQVSGRMEKVYSPNNRPVLVMVADWFSCL